MIDPYAPFEAVETCEPIFDDDTLRAKRAGVFAFRAHVLDELGGRDLGIARQCQGPPSSKHHESRAWDWGPESGDPAAIDAWHTQAGELIVELLSEGAAGAHELARRFGLRTIIFDRKIYNAGEFFEPAEYTGEDEHRTHVHFGFSRAGAKGRTSGYEPKGGWPGVAIPLLAAAALIAALILNQRQRAKT